LVSVRSSHSGYLHTFNISVITIENYTAFKEAQTSMVLDECPALPGVLSSLVELFLSLLLVLSGVVIPETWKHSRI
jgi:hypothetical protein